MFNFFVFDNISGLLKCSHFSSSMHCFVLQHTDAHQMQCMTRTLFYTPFHILAACLVCTAGHMVRSSAMVLCGRRTGVAVKGFTTEQPAVLFVSPIHVFCIPSTLAKSKYDLQHHHLVQHEHLSTHLCTICTHKLEWCAHTTNCQNEKYQGILDGQRAQAGSLCQSRITQFIPSYYRIYVLLHTVIMRVPLGWTLLMIWAYTVG